MCLCSYTVSELCSFKPIDGLETSGFINVEVVVTVG